MAIKNFTKGGTAGLPYADRAKCFVIHNTVDFSEAGNELASADVAEVLNIPAGTLVLRAGHRVINPEGATAAGTLGDGAVVAGYLAASNLNAAAGTVQVSSLALTEGTPNTVTGYSAGKFYAAADTIDFVAGNNIDDAVVDFFAVCIDLNG